MSLMYCLFLTIYDENNNEYYFLSLNGEDTSAYQMTKNNLYLNI